MPTEPQSERSVDPSTPTPPPRQFAQYDVLSHPDGRAEITRVDNFEVYLDPLDDGTAFQPGWVSKRHLRALLTNDDQLTHRQSSHQR